MTQALITMPVSLRYIPKECAKLSKMISSPFEEIIFKFL